MKTKKVLSIFAGLSLLVACSSSNEIKETVEIKAFGPYEVDDSKAISTQEMLRQFKAENGDQEFTFEGKITEVCSNAGCWVSIDRGNGETFMVRFKDHFTIPLNTKIGSTAYLHGLAYMDTVQVEDLKHFAQDAGKSEAEIKKITKPEYSLNFEADGILFKTVKKEQINK
ncbi:MAG: hypothetical protein RLZZ569_98 [Bacteroidota bacterium]|jgi:hypothetical protein